jgi:hypothetical protein
VNLKAEWAAAVQFGIPIIRVSIDTDIPHPYRGRYLPRFTLVKIK